MDRPTYCGQCGSVISAGDRFCGVCGATVQPDAHNDDSDSTREMPAQEVYAPPSAVRRGRRRIGAVIFAAIALLALTGAVAYATLGPDLGFLSNSDPSSAPGDAVENTVEEETTANEDTVADETAQTSEPTQPAPPSSPPAAAPPPAQSPPPQETQNETRLRQAVEEYYEAASNEDWDYTYDNLDVQTKRRFGRDEWRRKNQWFNDNNDLVSFSAENDLSSAGNRADVSLNLTFEDGSTVPRETYFVLEGNAWRHRFTGDEYELFMPDASFQEFVEAQGG